MSDSNNNKDVDQLLAEIEGLTEPQDDNDKPPPIRALATDHSAAGRGERPALLPPPSPGPDILDYTLGSGREASAVTAVISGFDNNLPIDADTVQEALPELHNEQPPGEVAASLSELPPAPDVEDAPENERSVAFPHRRNQYLLRLERCRRPTAREWDASPPVNREELHSFTLDLMNRMLVNFATNDRAFNMQVNDRRFSIIPELLDDVDPDGLDLGGVHCTREYVPSAGGGHIRTPTFAEILQYAQTGLQQRDPSRRENRPLLRITPTGYNSPARYQTPLQTQYNRWKQLIYDLPSGFSPEDRQLFREMLDSLDYHRRSLFWARTGEFVTARSFDHGGYELDEVDWDRDESELRDIDWGNFVLPPNLNVIYGEMRMHVELFQTLERRYSPNG